MKRFFILTILGLGLTTWPIDAQIYAPEVVGGAGMVSAVSAP